MEKAKLQDLLEKLVQAICSIINDGLSSGTLKPQYERYFRWKVTEFDHDAGVKKSAKGEELLKPYWGEVIEDIFQQVNNLNIYKDTIVEISKNYQVEEDQSTRYLRALIMKISGDILERKFQTASDSAKYIVSFLKDLNGEKQEYRAEVQLSGLVLQPRSIKLDKDVILRKPVRKDFEKELDLSMPHDWHEPDPTAFLNIRIYAEADVNSTHSFRTFNTLQNEIEKGVSVLRLFRVGAVQHLSFTTGTDSVLNYGTVASTSRKTIKADKYLLARKDVKTLKMFWSKVKGIELPISIPGEQKEPNELTIAYDRYSDSLEGGVIEKRISSAVMGLEALFLGEEPKERGEPRYKLRLRVSKLLSLLGHNPSEVMYKMRDAYDIRSTYVHGNLISKKNRRKYENSYRDLNEFSKTIMDYLRASIVALLKRPRKTTLIQKLDDSFLDSNQEEDIRKLLFIPYKQEATHATG